MLFLLVDAIICLQNYDLTNVDPLYSLVLYFDPLEKIEVKIKSGIGVFFSFWENIGDLYMDIVAITSKGETINYGPFGSSSFLGGIYFKSRNCTLKFTYEGVEKTKFSLCFSKKYELPYICSENFIFPISEYIPSDYWKEKKLADLDNPFIYYLESEKRDLPIILLYVFMVLVIFGFPSASLCCSKYFENNF